MSEKIRRLTLEQEAFQEARLRIVAELQDMLMLHMNWPADKAELWMITSNPNFGNIPPMTLVLLGLGHKVWQFIESAIDEGTVLP